MAAGRVRRTAARSRRPRDGRDLAATRLTYRINRFEIRAILVATIVSVAVSAAVIGWIADERLRRGAWSRTGRSRSPASSSRTSAAGRAGSPRSRHSCGAFPVLAGLLLGAPLIAREIDRGTARLAWSLGPSRRRWYLQRILPILVVVVAGVDGDRDRGRAAGRAASRPESTWPTRSSASTRRGVLLATSALLIASVAVAVGAVLGRQMPTLLLALVLGGMTLLAVAEVDGRLLAGDAVRLTGDEPVQQRPDRRPGSLRAAGRTAR